MPDPLSVVLVSNRGPMSFVETPDGLGIKRGAGGLAGALHPVVRRLGDDAVWIAAATSEIDRKALAAGAMSDLAEQLGYRVRLLETTPEDFARYYDVISNRMLWFANHCLWDELGVQGFEASELAAWEDAYEPMNRRFAEAVMEMSSPESLVLFQDYHLSTAPRYLREARPGQTSLHFTHSSFCCPGLQRLPEPIVSRVLGGMLAADLVGFHTHKWAGSFLDCCEGIGATVNRQASTVEFRDHLSWVRAYPITIAADDLKKRAAREPARDWSRRFLDPNRKLVVRADRTEPSKNILRGFEAFADLLERRQDLVGKVTFVACLYPSRQSMPEYREYVHDIERSVADLNERYPGSVDLFMKDDFDRTLGALASYDVLLVNSLMDGMNLVSKEGPSINERGGVLVLSSGAGSYEELKDACIPIEDPYDVAETSRALEEALDVPAPRRMEMAGRLKAIIEQSAPSDWIESQLDDLIAIRATGSPLTAP